MTKSSAPTAEPNGRVTTGSLGKVTHSAEVLEVPGGLLMPMPATSSWSLRSRGHGLGCDVYGRAAGHALDGDGQAGELPRHGRIPRIQRVLGRAGVVEGDDQDQVGDGLGVGARTSARSVTNRL